MSRAAAETGAPSAGVPEEGSADRTHARAAAAVPPAWDLEAAAAAAGGGGKGNGNYQEHRDEIDIC
jgi:hypothetical protein